MELTLTVRVLGRIGRVAVTLAQLAGFVVAGAMLVVLVAETLFPEAF